MTKIAIAVDGDFAFPIYRKDGKYCIDFGGAIGMSDLIEFENDVKAIRYLHKVVADGIWDH